MNARLTRALTEGERHTPDPAEVLAGVRDGIVRRRRRHRYAVVGAAALAVLVVTGGGVLVGVPGRQAPRPADDPPATSAPPAAQPVPPQPCRLRFRWLPAGLSTPPFRSCGPGIQSVLYPMGGGSYLSVEVDQSGWQAAATKAGWTPVSINGRPGRSASRKTRSFVVFPLPSGRWVSVEYGHGQPGGPATTGLAETARRIAENIDEEPAAILTAPFAPGYLPAGQRLAGVLGDGVLGGRSGVGLSYHDGSGRSIGPEKTGAVTEDGIPADMPFIDIGTEYQIRWAESGTGETYGADHGESVADIQGLPAYLLNQGDVVVVDGFHGGELSVSVASPMPGQPGRQPGALTDELVKIAEGVRWTG